MVEREHPVGLDHLGAPLACRPRVGVGGAIAVEVAFVRVEECTQQAGRIDDRDHRRGLLRGKQVRVGMARAAHPREFRLEPAPPLRGAGELQAAGHPESYALAALFLDLGIEADRVLLQRGDPSVGVDCVKTASCVPRGARVESVALDHGDIGHAAQGEVVRDADADDPAADDHDAVLALHASTPCGCAWRPSPSLLADRQRNRASGARCGRLSPRLRALPDTRASRRTL